MEVLRGNPNNLKENIKTLEGHKINPAEFTALNSLRLPPAKFREFLETPRQEVVTKYSFSNKRDFNYLLTRLHEDEQVAFKEIGKAIEEKKEVTKDEVEEIFKKHVTSPYPAAVDSRLNKILKSLVDDCCLKKVDEVVEKDVGSLSTV